MIDIAETTRKIDALVNRHQNALQQVEQERVAVDDAKTSVIRIESARSISQVIAEELQSRAHDRIARVVTRCLEAVFDDPYEFKIVFERKRGKTEALLVLTRDGQVLDRPMDEVGGGVLDVAGLALRLACVLVSRPPARRVLILDEPFRFIRGAENRSRTKRMLELLAEEFGVQWIINTDIPDYKLGRVVDVG